MDCSSDLSQRLCHKDDATKTLARRSCHKLCRKDFVTNLNLSHKHFVTHFVTKTLSQRVCHNDDLKDDTCIIDQILKLESIVMF